MSASPFTTDSTFVNGYPAGTFMDALLVKSNNLPWSATLKIAVNPSEGDTVTIAGVTFTFKATPAAAFDVDIGAERALAVRSSPSIARYSRGPARRTRWMSSATSATSNERQAVLDVIEDRGTGEVDRRCSRADGMHAINGAHPTLLDGVLHGATEVVAIAGHEILVLELGLLRCRRC